MSEQKKYVVKSNDLIEARYRLGLQESHVVLWLISQIKPDDDNFQTHRLSVEQFAKMAGLGVGKSAYEDLQKATYSLVQRAMKIYEPGQKKTIQVSWLSSAVYEEGKGYVTLEFSPQLKPYLLQLKSHFTKVNMDEAFELKSVHALRIYELLTQYSPIGKRQITVEELREYCGIKEEEYKLYGHLKAKVIDRARNEINEKTHYEIGYKEIKTSRKVTAINWSIVKKDQEKQESVINQPLLPPIKNLTDEVCLHKIKEITKFCKHYENEVSGVHYLLNVTDVKIEKDTLKLTFSSPFFKSQCESNIILVDRLGKFFKTKHVELS